MCCTTRTIRFFFIGPSGLMPWVLFSSKKQLRLDGKQSHQFNRADLGVSSGTSPFHAADTPPYPKTSKHFETGAYWTSFCPLPLTKTGGGIPETRLFLLLFASKHFLFVLKNHHWVGVLWDGKTNEISLFWNMGNGGQTITTRIHWAFISIFFCFFALAPPVVSMEWYGAGRKRG